MGLNGREDAGACQYMKRVRKDTSVSIHNRSSDRRNMGDDNC
jgi:hypothetical protein